MTEADPLRRRRKVFRWIVSVGLVVFTAYLVFIVSTLHGCSHAEPTP